MAEELDPFEAAMASMNNDNGDKPDDPQHSDKDPFATEEGEKEHSEATPVETSDAPPNAEGAKANSETDPFDTAMAAMDAISETDGTKPAEGESETSTPDLGIADDPFAAALEVAKTQHSVSEAQKPGRFAGQEIDIDFLMDINCNLTFEVGRTKMFITDLLSLGQGSVIELHRLVGEELELFVNGQLLATGEVVVINEKFGARIAKILTPEERIARLGPMGND